MTAQDFPLASRWTQSERGPMPSSVLARITPMTPFGAVRLNMRAMTFFQKSRTLSPEVFSTIIANPVEIPAEKTREWLLKQHPGDCPVFVSWRAELALETSWHIITDYWDAFCYPSSDDLAVWPENEQWVLAYYHNETFEFGRKR